MADALLIYDGDCAFCTKCVVWGKKHLKNFPAHVAYQLINPNDYALTQSQVAASIWLVVSNSPALPANLAVAAILKDQPNPLWRALGWAMNLIGARQIARWLYFLVAKNRHRMPGSSQACELPDNL